MAYTTIDKPSDYFETNLHTGTGSTHNITSLDFAPNFVWLKSRTQGGTGYNGMHYLFDTIRGATKRVRANDNSAEATSSASLTAFNSDGFTLGSDEIVNKNGDAYVSWNWKAGTSFTNDASATGIGTIDSTGSVSQEAGFSITSYTGNGSAGATVAHGLGSIPSAIFVKKRNDLGDWSSYHSVLGNTGYMRLNNSNAFATASTYWNNTTPTSSVFTTGTTGNINGSGSTYIAYCFAEKQGYSKFGSYTGNGNADGTFVYTGFKPAFVLIKVTSTTNDWEIHDNKRGSSNVINAILQPNLSDAESTSGREIDFLSNGFKLRNSNSQNNLSGGTFIYMAFAENPFVTSSGVPACAR